MQDMLLKYLLTLQSEFVINAAVAVPKIEQGIAVTPFDMQIQK